MASPLDERMADQPHMLHELCEGCPNIREEIFAFDYPNGVRMRLCRSCWVQAWLALATTKEPAHPE